MMQSAAILTQNADLVEEVLNALRADPGLQDALGTPARIFDTETEAAAFPYIVLERYQRTDTSVSQAVCAEHSLQFVSFSDYGGQVEAKRLLSRLRLALQRMQISPAGQNVVLVHPAFSDVMRTRNPQISRGLLRVRIHTEEI
ncbi:MAG: DUF3168 domain-containing protein [Pseudomonadota bacterium]